MINNRLTLLLLATALALSASPLSAQEPVKSLRGANAIDNTSNPAEFKPWDSKGGRIPKTFDKQPPLVPHKTEHYAINLDVNRCLSCHDRDNYEKRKAVRISDTHYMDRDGNPLDHVSAARYFCTQCHVEQRVTQPLVGNEFDGEGTQ